MDTDTQPTARRTEPCPCGIDALSICPWCDTDPPGPPPPRMNVLSFTGDADGSVTVHDMGFDRGPFPRAELSYDQARVVRELVHLRCMQTRLEEWTDRSPAVDELLHTRALRIDAYRDAARAIEQLLGTWPLLAGGE